MSRHIANATGLFGITSDKMSASVELCVLIFLLECHRKGEPPVNLEMGCRSKLGNDAAYPLQIRKTVFTKLPPQKSILVL